jgi:hypothetical protein
MALQSAPDVFQLKHALQGGIAGIERPVQRADAGADHHIGENSMLGERVHHADLDGTKTAAAGEYKSRLLVDGGIGNRQSPGRSLTRRVGEGPRGVPGSYSSQGLWRATTHHRHSGASGARVRNPWPSAQWIPGLRRRGASRNDEDLTARRRPSRSRNGRARCGCLRGSRAPRTSGAVRPACRGCRTS